MDILFFTVNAGYIHPAMGLWYLRANLNTTANLSVETLELTRRAGEEHIIQEVLRRRPRILAVGLYIWNHLDLLPVLRAVRTHLPETTVILGGPEATHLPADHPTLSLAHIVVRGEGELLFGPLVDQILAADPTDPTDPNSPNGQHTPRFLTSTPPELDRLRLPHHLFSDKDIQNRFMYLEASRGCPFRCQFCLSSLDRTIRHAPLEQLFDMADHLISRGARRFKFIDRTFNLDYQRASTILEFWLARLHTNTPDMSNISLQFETVPDRFPPDLRKLIRRFPPDTLRLEVGVQTFNPQVAAAIDRRADPVKTEETLAFLSAHTNAVVHADLIVGLPGETLESFAAGFDRLYRFRPQEVQVGVLKRLHGAPIAVHDPYMHYNPDPPYDIIATDALSAPDIERLKRFARYWELVVNRNRFPHRVTSLLTPPPPAPPTSPFHRFLAFTDFAWQRFGRTWALTPQDLSAALDTFLAIPFNP